MMYVVTIKKTVSERYVIEHDEGGSPINKDQAMRLATLYAQLPEHERRFHATADKSHVGHSNKVLGIKSVEAARLERVELWSSQEEATEDGV